MALSLELRSRARLPEHVGKVLAALPEGTHPMTQFSTAVLALQVPTRRAIPCKRAHSYHICIVCRLKSWLYVPRVGLRSGEGW